MWGGNKTGIDLKVGALMTVKFAYTPPLKKIRWRSAATLRAEKLHGSIREKRSGDRYRTRRRAPVEYQSPSHGKCPGLHIRTAHERKARL